MGNEIFQERIRQLRNSKGLTMEALAKDLGVTKSRVNMWENNGTVPRSDMLTRLSVFFGVGVDYLLGNDLLAEERPAKGKLHVLQRGLERLDGERLQKAEEMLKIMFDDIFDEDEDHGDL